MSGRPLQALPSAGFTLTELAVVLVIVSLLIGGLLVPLSAQIDARNVSDTRASLAEIREALLGYAAVNGRLPCPAVATAGDGTEQFNLLTGQCPSEVGVLPWATLGVRKTDAWGRRYTYRVTRVFAQCVAPAYVLGTPCTPGYSFVLSSPGGLDVRSTAGGSVIASKVPAVVISHGKNGNGAYSRTGTQFPTGADVDEQENQLISPAGVVTMANFDFVSKTPTATFDDEVMWISPGVLFNRMISVGRLP